MPRFTSLLVLLMIAMLAMSLWAAHVPELMNYQGILTNSIGAALDTTVSITFTIYDDSTGGIPIWVETHPSVVVTDGLFNVRLGEFSAAGPDTIFHDPERWLGIVVGSDPPIEPRTRLVAAPYAFHAAFVDGFHSGPKNIDSGLYTLVGGDSNTVMSDYSVIAGGYGNEIDIINIGDTLFDTTSIAGNRSFGMGFRDYPAPPAYIGPGIFCQSLATGTVICGGAKHKTPCSWSSVVGGWFNLANDNGTFIGGGAINRVGATIPCDCGWLSAIAGGQYNVIEGHFGFIGGGLANRILGCDNYNTLSGGHGNEISGTKNTIAGGEDNTVYNTGSTIGGGEDNSATGYPANYSTIAGGQSNNTARSYASIGGGYDNTIGGAYSTIPGGSGNFMDNVEYGTIGGGQLNKIEDNFGTISGGDSNYMNGEYGTIGGGYKDTVNGPYATVGGGSGNRASQDMATVSGGQQNKALGYNSTIGGGALNSAQGNCATIPGGMENVALGSWSFAAGKQAHADDDCSFVWADCCDASPFASSGNNTFNVRACGGTYIYSSGDLSTGVWLPSGGGAWQAVSDREMKRGIQPVDGVAILDKLDQLPVSRWYYKNQDPSIQHIGPMAQDFHALFGVGDDDKSISTIDPDGIALAAIKELHKVQKELTAKVQQIEHLEAQIGQQEARSRRLETRMAQLEALVQTLLAQQNDTKAGSDKLTINR